MEQSLIRSRRNKFLEELACEGERLLARAEMEQWFGPLQGRKMGVQFLAHRLQSMQWEMESMRQEPLRLLLEMISHGITEPVAASLLAIPKGESSRLRSVHSGDVYRQGLQGRWEVIQGALLHPMQIRMRWEGRYLTLEWRSPQPLPPVLDCPLYSAQGDALWQLYGLSYALRAHWLYGSETGPIAQIRQWHFTECGLRDYWVLSKENQGCCGWRFHLPLASGPRPCEAKLRLEPLWDHPLTGMAGFLTTLEQADSLSVQPLLKLRNTDLKASWILPEMLEACDPNTSVRLLQPLASTGWPGCTAELNEICVWIASWARWVLDGKKAEDFASLLPESQMLRMEGNDSVGPCFALESCAREPGAMPKLGRELERIGTVLRQCRWLLGEDSPWEMRIVGRGK